MSLVTGTNILQYEFLRYILFFLSFFFLFTKIKMFTSSKQSFIMYFRENLNSVQFSHSVMSDYLRPHESQHARPSCPSPIPRVHPDSCPLSQWCHLIICHPLLLLPSTFPSIRVFSNESALCIRWPKYGSLSFNISPSNEHQGLISFRMDWLDLLAIQGTLKSLLEHQSSKASILRCSAFFRRRQWQPTPVLLPEKAHGWRGLVGCSPWGR